MHRETSPHPWLRHGPPDDPAMAPRCGGPHAGARVRHPLSTHEAPLSGAGAGAPDRARPLALSSPIQHGFGRNETARP